MGQVIIRNLEDSVKAKLKRRAKRHGRSMEAELRDILRDAVKHEERPAEGLGTQISRLFSKVRLRKGEEIPELRGYTIEPPDFSK